MNAKRAVSNAIGLEGIGASLPSVESVRLFGIKLELLRGRRTGLEPGQVTVIEDTEAGVLAAKHAAMRCLALLGTMPAERLRAADEVIETIDLPLA